jgi:hypothetical protein
VWEAEPGRSGSERQSPHPVRGDVRGAFLGGSVDIHGQGLPVPVQLFGGVGVVVDIDDYGFTFGKAQEGPGELAVVNGGRHHPVGRQLYQTAPGMQCVIGVGARAIAATSRDGGRRTASR